MGGVARAASNSGAMVLDSGISSSIEKFCIRKGVRLVGVCPEAQICYPKLTVRKTNELSNGHTHFLLIGKDDKSCSFEWGNESAIKYELAQRITAGRVKGMSRSGDHTCKAVTVVLGDNEESAIRDIETSLNAKIPIIVIEGSKLAE